MRIVTVALAASFLFASAATADPRVTWEPRKLTAEVAAGTTQTFSVDLTLSDSADGLAITVVPELADLVTVSPAAPPPLAAGESLTLVVTVAPPAASPAAFLDGTIHVRAGNATLARPLPVALNIITDPLNATDADGDGVWDDVQDWIDTNYTPGTELYFALRQVARAVQLEIQASDNEELSLRVANNESTRASDCLFLVGGDSAIRDMNALQAFMLRTDARTNAYLMFESHLGGHVFRGYKLSGPDQVCENR